MEPERSSSTPRARGQAAWSRKHEFEADAYAAEAQQSSAHLIAALKKLSIDNLSNLTPHQLRVVLDYSHPPVLVRIQALRSLASAPPP